MAKKNKSLWEKVLSFDFRSNSKSSKQPEQRFFSEGETLFTIAFDGEKNLGETGPAKNYIINYKTLRVRSWQSFLESPITQTVINRYITWVVSKGLKLQSEPLKDALESEGITIKTEIISKQIETRFNCFKNTKCIDYSKMKNLDAIAWDVEKNALLSGDVLVVLGFDGKYMNIRLIDAASLESPMYGSEQYPQKLKNGNKIVHGVEMTPQGEHVAYWIKSKTGKYESIQVYGIAGLKMAFLYTGGEYRLNNVRGLPMIAAVIEKLKKMERYEEATIGSAEERQKIAYTIEHQVFSDGSNPLDPRLVKAFKETDTEDIPVDSVGNALADKIAVSTNKQAWNMPKGSKLTMLDSKNELYFTEFFTTNIKIVCASLGIPYQVAMSFYEGNFSASRAALKDWEHTLMVARKKLSDQFYQPVYNFWLYLEILQGKISADGYIKATDEGNEMVISAYQNARFVGTSVPHIDPLKEVNAERAKLGPNGMMLPLTTFEAATESLNGGDSGENLKQFAKEVEEAKKLGVIVDPPPLDPNQIQQQLNQIIEMTTSINERLENVEQLV